MRLLLFGGTFDPPHVGHMRLALEACEALAPDRFIFVPAGRPPHKPGPRLQTSDRLTLLRAALAELADCTATPMAIETLELAVDGPQFTVDTLAILHQRWPDASLNLLLGMDSLAALHTWHQPSELFTYANLIVAPRPAYRWPTAGPLAAELSRRRTELSALPQAGAVAELPAPPLAVASSDVRMRLTSGRNVAYLLPPAVADLINSRGYYAADSKDSY